MRRSATLSAYQTCACSATLLGRRTLSPLLAAAALDWWVSDTPFRHELSLLLRPSRDFLQIKSAAVVGSIAPPFPGIYKGMSLFFRFGYWWVGWSISGSLPESLTMRPLLQGVHELAMVCTLRDNERLKTVASKTTGRSPELLCAVLGGQQGRQAGPCQARGGILVPRVAPGELLLCRIRT